MKLQFNTNLLKLQEQYQGSILADGAIAITPPVGNENYWLFRVELSDKQAIICFPKFCTLGIGFQKEEDWNTNLPYSCETEKIYNHIKHNKGDENISDADCLKAIKMIQDACISFKG